MEVLIANPIYDVVFKYMMEDNAVAKLMVSSIIGEEIISLDPQPQEYTKAKMAADDKGSSITVYRLDFSAKIKTADGYKLVLIELQKATLPTDIVRFRHYLGEQYIKANENTASEDDPECLQLYCLYFLGKDIGISNIPVVEVNPQARDVATKSIIDQKNYFIEALNHRSWIIQINCLKEPRRTELEQLLSVFDQNFRTSDHHILNIREEDFPQKYRAVIRRLKRAAGDAKVKKQMRVEDQFVNYIRRWFRSESKKNIQKIQKMTETIEDQEKIIESKEKIIEEERKNFEAQRADLEAQLKDAQAQLELLSNQHS